MKSFANWPVGPVHFFLVILQHKRMCSTLPISPRFSRRLIFTKVGRARPLFYSL